MAVRAENIGNQRLRRGNVFSAELHCSELDPSGIGIRRRGCAANELLQQLRAVSEFALKGVEICQGHLEGECVPTSFDAVIELLSRGGRALCREEKANDLEFGGRISRIGRYDRTHQLLRIIQSLMHNVELHELRFERDFIWAKFNELSQLRLELLQISRFLKYFG